MQTKLARAASHGGRKPRPKAGTLVQPQPERKSRNLWICVALFFASFVVYAQVRDFDFVTYDDPSIMANPHINHGLTRDGLAWAFTAYELGNWIPITQLSHMLDFELFGARSGLHHFTPSPLCCCLFSWSAPPALAGQVCS